MIEILLIFITVCVVFVSIEAILLLGSSHNRKKRGYTMAKGVRGAIIKRVQKVADTKGLKARASEVSRIASLTLDEVMKEISGLLGRRR